jgi:hypothetical protein
MNFISQLNPATFVTNRVVNLITRSNSSTGNNQTARCLYSWRFLIAMSRYLEQAIRAFSQSWHFGDRTILKRLTLSHTNQSADIDIKHINSETFAPSCFTSSELVKDDQPGCEAIEDLISYGLGNKESPLHVSEGDFTDLCKQ